jgi:hydroxycarboxylate dehydrogenase B
VVLANFDPPDPWKDAISGKRRCCRSNGKRLIALAMTIHIPADALTGFCAEIFACAGCELEEAGRVSASLVDSNLTGHDSHGVIRVPRYVDWVRSGDLVPNQSMERVVDTPVIGVVDGRFGFGQTMAPMAVDIGIEKAKATGLSAISLRNSGHIGRVGEWAERAAAAGLISIHFVNAAGSILVAPFGGLERRLSTAPFCVGVHREGAPPVVLDFATSLVAEGKVNVASHGGKPLPPDALIGPDGAFSGDPALIYGPLTSEGTRDHKHGAGAMRAFGEHKGSGLALLCELLGGSLTGNGATEPDRKFANGMFSLYLDPSQIDPAHVFDADMTRYLDWFQQGKAIPGEAILTPGEPERASRVKRAQSGVPLSDEAWTLIKATARSVGVNRDLSF